MKSHEILRLFKFPMQANQQSRTFNNHNQIKNDYVNRLTNPHMNKISLDLNYKSKAIHPVVRNPEHINGGSEYLYNKRIKLIQRQLKNRQITPEQYNAELKRIQLARFGEVRQTQDVYVRRTPMNRKVNTQPVITKPESKEENDENKTVEENNETVEDETIDSEENNENTENTETIDSEENTETTDSDENAEEEEKKEVVKDDRPIMDIINDPNGNNQK